MDPSTACVDCQWYEGNGTDLKYPSRAPAGHGGYPSAGLCPSHGTLRQACVLLMNGIFLFVGRDLGLGSFNDSLGCVVENELCPKSFVSLSLESLI